MNTIAYFIIGLATVNVLNGYVLQVREDDKQSNIDALIHKAVPVKKSEKIADTARKHFKNHKQYRVKRQVNDKDLESIVLAIKTDDAKDGNGENLHGRSRRRENENVANLWSDLKQLVNSFVKPDAAGANFRSKVEKYNIKPERIELRSGEPSMMYQIQANSVLKSLNDALKSQTARRYSEKIAKAAAYVYRLIKED
ncbi:uncharacterized protein LOC123879438 [Maniola jurtina]|uniref:uncharacterized protein LOC123879438 n=1 Tax=Maniola jurtina TaxID=191418 RepID=UPI001E6879B6|nr:uncharacterized protein LOC123879438 [Maniola jurtina]